MKLIILLLILISAGSTFYNQPEVVAISQTIALILVIYQGVKF